MKTFAWRLIRRAIATGLRASRFSKHIKKECCRCGLIETDLHLFFQCSFSRSIWFSFGLKTDMLNSSLYPADIIHMICSGQQSELKLDTIFTTLWNIWKARNDLLFNKRKWSPMQVLPATVIHLLPATVHVYICFEVF